VEGGNLYNDWWAAEQAGTVPHQSGDACDHYDRYLADFDLARRWGHTAHRFSIEWSRIEPRRGEMDADALEHYRGVLQALRDRGIEPLVTLHHFTNPIWFAERGGWERRDSVSLYLRYVDRVVRELGGHVRYWLTINEPTVYVKRAFVAGSWPPHGRRAFRRGWRVFRNLLKAHRQAYQLIHSLEPGAQVGFAHSTQYVAPHDPSRWLDRMAARMRGWLLNHLSLDLPGTGRLPLDFLGINYYARELVRCEPSGLAAVFGRETQHDLEGRPRRLSDLGWEMYAGGLTRVLHEFSRYGVPLVVTENGVATRDEGQRLAYLESHLRALAAAVREGVDVRGYCYWSLLDNFEWAEGFSARFGLATVDRETQRRTPTPAALRYAEVCRSNGAVLQDHQPIRRVALRSTEQ